LNKNKHFSTKVIAESIMFVALATILSNIKIFEMPQGGSVTLGSMVPILWLALRRGPKVGIFAATVYGVVQFAPGPYIVHPAQVILGVAGFFQKRPFVGVTLASLGRFGAHFISGILFWSIYAPQGMSPVVYSAVYNGGYMLVEFVISVYVIYLLRASNVLDIYL
jgi:thiamine transporter